MNRWWLYAAGLLLLAGCQQPSKTRHRPEPAARWKELQAEVRVKLAEERMAAGRFDEAAAELASAVRLTPGSPRAAMASARLALARGDLDGAERWLAQAQQGGEAAAELHFLWGAVHEAGGDPNRALIEYARAMQARPSDPHLPLTYARALLAADRARDARDFLSGAQADVCRRGNPGEYHQLLGDIYLTLNEPRQAADSYELADRFGELPRHTRQIHAFLLMELGRWPEAARAFESLVLESSEAPAPLVIAWSRSLLQVGRVAEARRRLAVLLRTEGDNPQVWMLLAQATALSDDWGRAVNTARRAVELAPNDAPARQLLAVLAARDGQWAVAREAAEAAVRLTPDDELGARVLRWVAGDAESPAPAFFGVPRSE